MKKIITAALILIAFNSKGQTYSGFSGFSNKYEKPLFDTSKAIVIYLEGLNVKADSCFIYKTANEMQMVSCPEGRPGCLVAHWGPAWSIVKVVGYSKKSIELKSVIQYK